MAQSMSRHNRVAAMLNVEPGEGWLTALLFILSFFIGSTIVFGLTAAYALFVTTWGVANLPYIYILGAFLISTVGAGFTALERRVQIGTLLIATLVSLLAAGVALRLGLLLSQGAWLVFAVMLWFELTLVLSGLVFWGLAGNLLNLEQGKRLFGLIGSGEVAARVLSYLSVPVLVGMVGTANLLWLSIASLGLCVVVLLLLRTFTRTEAKPPVERSTHAAPRRTTELLKNRYIFLILLSSLATMVAYWLVEFTFFGQLESRFPDADEFAGFLGLFSGITFTLSFATSAIASGRLLKRFGLQVGLLLRPALVACGIIAVAVAVFVGSPLAVVFWLVILTKLFDELLAKAIHRPSFQLLYQPLKAEDRLSAQTMAHSMMEPAAMALTGLLLLLFRAFGTIRIEYLVYGLLPLVIGSLVVSALLSREYIAALSHALKRRFLGDTIVSFEDASSLQTIERTLQNPHPGAALYALDLLHQHQPNALERVFPIVLSHPESVVRREALLRVGGAQPAAAAPAITALLEQETDSEVRAAAVQALCAMESDDTRDRMAAYLDSSDPALRDAAIIGLLRRGGDPARPAYDRLVQIAGAPERAERLRAAAIVGEVRDPGLLSIVTELLRDDDIEVRRATLRSAAHYDTPAVQSMLIDALSDAAVRRAAVAALTGAGAAIRPALARAFERYRDDRDVCVQLATICGKIGGPAATDILAARLSTPDLVVRSAVLQALRRCGYRATGDHVTHVRRQIRAEAEEARRYLGSRMDFGDEEETALLRAALLEGALQSRDRIFDLLSFVYDRQAIMRARDHLMHPSNEKRIYAREAIEVTVSHEMRLLLLPLIAGDEFMEHSQRRRETQPRLDPTTRLREIISLPDGRTSGWIKACAIDCVGRLNMTALTTEVEAAQRSAEPLVREIAGWAYRQLQTGMPNRNPPQADDASWSVATTAATPQTIGDIRMLSTIEKVILLKSSNIFAQTPDTILAEIAALLEEQTLRAGETLFAGGDSGDSMYIIVEGEVRVHHDGATLNHLTNGDVFGEMALLDSEPRMASVTAVSETRLLRLDHEPFFELMADRIEVAQGIIKVLLRHIRDRVRDLQALRAQAKL